MDMSAFEVIDESMLNGARVQVLQYRELKGSSDVRTAEKLFFVSNAGMRLKMVKVSLNKGRLRSEPGALYFMEGNLQMTSSTNGGVLSGLARKAFAGESFFVNEIAGTGDVFLEPTFGHFLLVNINDDEIIVDKSMFYAGVGNLDVSAAIQSRLSAAAVGGEGIFQTRIKGTGTAILFSPVPMSEVQVFNLNNSKLSVDGNFALMRTSGVTFSVEKSSKSWIGTAVSGEGLLQTFTGTGQVWIAPTQGVYERLATPSGLESLAGPGNSMGTKVK